MILFLESGNTFAYTIYELGAIVKSIAEWITTFAEAALVVIGLSVFIYWILISWKNIELWSVVFWSLAATREQFILKYKTSANDPVLEYEFHNPEKPYQTEGFTIISAPAITLRAQLVNPVIWPQIYDDAELEVKFCTAILEQRNKVTTKTSEWDNCVWDAEYFGGTFGGYYKQSGARPIKSLTFCVLDSFKPIVVKSRSEVVIEIIFIPYNFITKRAKVRNQKAPSTDKPDVLPKWLAGAYKCTFILIQRNGRRKKIDFWIELKNKDIDRYNREDVGKLIDYTRIRDYNNKYAPLEKIWQSAENMLKVGRNP